MLLVTAAWTLFAFAGIYPWTTVPLAAGVVVLAVLVRPRPFSRSLRLLDFGLTASLLVIAVQLVPLPPAMRQAIAPSSVAYDRLLYVTPAQLARGGPISVDPGATAFALFIVAVTILLFWSARTAFTHGGVRATIRGLAWMGLVMTPIARAWRAARRSSRTATR